MATVEIFESSFIFYFFLIYLFFNWRIIYRILLFSVKPQHESVISSVQSLSHVQLFATPWIAARQASLSITNTQSSLKLTSIELVMPSSHLILCHPLFLLPPIPPSIRVFSNGSTLCMRWPKYIGIHISPHSWTSLPSPSPSHPSRLIQSPCLSFLSHMANSHWLSILHMISFHVTLSIHLTLSSPLSMSISLFSMSVSPLLPWK